MAFELVPEIGRRITAVTEEPREPIFSFQQLFIAIHRGNAVAFRGTFNAVNAIRVLIETDILQLSNL